MDSMYFQTAAFEVDTFKVLYKNASDRICSIAIDDEISKTMVGRRN